jgi:hypothetical protein
MAKKPTLSTIASGYASNTTLNSNFEELRDAFDNTLSLDGSTPNAMGADLDLNGNNIIGAAGLTVNGTDYLAEVTAAKAAALVAQAAAETAETNAETAETNAGASETAAATSATASQASRLAAETAETNAETAQAAASVSAGAAQIAETAAELAETGATTQAGIATTKATEAATSATNAATSETNAASSAASAQVSKDAALAALDSFDDRYLGQKATDPTVDNDGDALVSGALYFNTTDDVMKVYDGSLWVAAYASLSGAVLQANNLSDLSNVATSRTNLGLGSAATTDSTAYATAAQGALADTATQPSDLGTAATTAASDYATAAQGVKADASVQATATTGQANLPSGTTAQRTAGPIAGAMRFNSTDTSFEGYNGTEWGSIGGGAADGIFYENEQNVTANYTIAASKNAMTTGPITIDAGVSVTIETGARWVVL